MFYLVLQLELEMEIALQQFEISGYKYNTKIVPYSTILKLV